MSNNYQLQRRSQSLSQGYLQANEKFNNVLIRMKNIQL